MENGKRRMHDAPTGTLRKKRVRLEFILALFILPPLILSIVTVFQTANLSGDGDSDANYSSANLPRRKSSSLSKKLVHAQAHGASPISSKKIPAPEYKENHDLRIQEQIVVEVLTPHIMKETAKKEVDTPQLGTLFHFIHSSTERNFGVKQIKAIESVFYHHPRAQVKLWVTEMSAKRIQPFLDKGYNLTLLTLDLKSEVKSLLDYPEINQKIVEEFLGRWDENTKSKLWMINNSDLFRIILIYREGGIYMGT
jgi:hypothetical protein